MAFDTEIKIGGDTREAQQAVTNFRELLKDSFSAIEVSIARFNNMMLAFGEIKEILGQVTDRIKEAASASVQMFETSRTVSEALGIEQSEAQALNVALKSVGATTEAWMNAFSVFSRNLRTNAQDLEDWGVDVAALNAGTKTTQQVFRDALAHINDFASAATRGEYATRVFGRSLESIIPLARLNSEALEEGKQKIEEWGAALGADEKEKVDSYRKSLVSLQDSMELASVSIGISLAPMLEKLANLTEKLALELHNVITFGREGFSVAPSEIIDVADLHRQQADVAGEAAGGGRGTPKTAAQREQEIAAEADAARQTLVIKQQEIDAEEKMGQISGQEAIERKRALLDQMFQLQLSALTKIQALYSADADKQDEVSRRIAAASIAYSQQAAALREAAGVKRVEDAKAIGQAELEAELEGQKKVLDMTRQMLAQKKAAGEISAADEIESLKSLAEREYLDQVTNQAKQIELAGENVVARQKIFDKITALYQAFVAQMGQLDGQLATQEQSTFKSLQAIASGVDTAREKAAIDSIREQARGAVALKQITASEQIEIEKNLADREYAASQKSIEDQLARADLELNAQTQLYADMEALQLKHQATVQKLNNDLAIAQQEAARQFFAPFTSALDTAIQGIIQGTTTLRGALHNMWQSIVLEFVSKGVHVMVDEWIAGEAAKAAASSTTAAKLLGIQSASTGSVLGIKTAESISVILKSAAAGGAAAAAEAAPLGPEAVEAAFGSIYSLIAGLGVPIASAARGFDIPSGVNPLAQLHQREMVLPAEHADTIRSLKGKGIQPQTNITIHAVDSKSVERLFKDNALSLSRALHSVARDGRGPRSQRHHY